jgi:hypothetical protein
MLPRVPLRRLLERARDAVERRLPGAPEPSRKATPKPPPEEPAVVVYATLAEAEAVARIKAIFARHDAIVRQIDLATEPKVARQIAQDTGVFVPPYVFVGGRFWGAEYDVLSLDESGDLPKILHGRLSELSAQARRIGRVRESFSDAMTSENILDRLRRGHILCVDDLDCWFEPDEGEGRLYYEGGAHPGSELPALAERVAAAIEAGAEAAWRFEPEIKLR